MSNWWERTGNKIAYPNLRQGTLPHCVYAAIAGGVNHLVRQPVWTVQSLFDEHQKAGPKDANFGVADTAIVPVAGAVERLHHNRVWSQDGLSPDRIRGWLNAGAVVILSMELRNDAVSKRGGWHMFSLVAVDQGRFQVWDTNGFEGFLTDAELAVGFSYPNRWFFQPHDKEDALILKPKKAKIAEGENDE